MRLDGLDELDWDGDYQNNALPTPNRSNCCTLLALVVFCGELTQRSGRSGSRVLQNKLF